jgi:hypothetical protein
VALIFGTLPIFTALFARGSGVEHLPLRFWIAAALSFAGVALVALGSGGSLSANLKGDVLALVGSATWAAYSVAIGPLMRRYSPFRLSAVFLLSVTVALLALRNAADAKAGTQTALPGFARAIAHGLCENFGSLDRALLNLPEDLRGHIRARDPIRSRVPAAVEITIPKLVEMATEQVDVASVPFATFIANKKQSGDAASYSFVLRGYVRHWLGNVWGEYDRVGLTDILDANEGSNEAPIARGGKPRLAMKAAEST